MRLVLSVLLVATLAACAPTTGLAPGLSARMDQPGATLDTGAALNIVNHYRQSVGKPPLTLDPALSSKASSLAEAYAASGQSPAKPSGSNEILTSAGYPNFAETFSGWRNHAPDAAALADPAATRMGLAVKADPNAAYGVYWVLLLAGPAS